MKSLPQTAQGRSWATLGAEELHEESWRRLVRNEIPAVVIRGFATPEECRRLLQRSEAIGFTSYDRVVRSIDRIGVTVFEHGDSPFATYFAKAEQARAIQDQIFAQSFSPVARFVERMGELVDTQVSVAADPVHGAYYAGLIRRIEDGTLLHIDYAPVEQPDWWVAQVETQMTWNLYLELDPVDPGRTYVYPRPWVPADDASRIPNSYTFERAVVEGAEPFVLQPTVGDVYIFSTRNFHEVAPSKGRRTTVTSALGTLPDGRIILWS